MVQKISLKKTIYVKVGFRTLAQHRRRGTQPYTGRRGGQNRGSQVASRSDALRQAQNRGQRVAMSHNQNRVSTRSAAPRKSTPPAPPTKMPPSHVPPRRKKTTIPPAPPVDDSGNAVAPISSATSLSQVVKSGSGDLPKTPSQVSYGRRVSRANGVGSADVKKSEQTSSGKPQKDSPKASLNTTSEPLGGTQGGEDTGSSANAPVGEFNASQERTEAPVINGSSDQSPAHSSSTQVTDRGVKKKTENLPPAKNDIPPVPSKEPPSSKPHDPPSTPPQDHPVAKEKDGKAKTKDDTNKVKPVTRKGNSVTTTLDESNYDVEMTTDNIQEAEDKAQLTQRDKDKIYDAVVENSVQQQMQSNSKKVVPLPKIYVVRPKPSRVFRVVTSVWSMLLVVAIAFVGAYGYSTWNDIKLDRDKDAAYAQGVSSSTTKPDIQKVMKVSSNQLQGMITSAQGVTFPDNVSMSNYSLAGWNTPGGNQKESKVEIDFCYKGVGQKPAKGSVFFYTPNAVAVQPQWSVDTVSLTKIPCK